jgi:hypothetical protein
MPSLYQFVRFAPEVQDRRAALRTGGQMGDQSSVQDRTLCEPLARFGPLRFLRNARAIDPHLTVLARSPEEWRTFVAKQVEIERRWANRNTVTEADEAMLAAMGIAPWNYPSLENLLLAILPFPKP